jgi:hypothetical protein
MKYKKSLLLGLVSFLIFISASIYITFPLLFHLGDFATGLGDELVIAWIQSWVIHALSTNPLSLFNANILYPYHNTLAYSDAFLTGSLFSFILTDIIGQPIAANNMSLIISLAFDGFSLYLLTYYLTKDFFAALFSGLLFIFSPAILSFSAHLQILAVGLVPLAILFFLLFVEKFKTKYLVLSLLCFLLQSYNSFLPGYFIVFSLVIILLYRWFENKKKTKQLFSKKNIILVLLTLLFLFPVALPYYQVSKEFHYVRDIRDTIHFALQPEDLLYPGDTTRLKNVLLTLPTNKYSQGNEFKPGYLGVVFTLITIFVFIYLIKNWKSTRWLERSFLTISLCGLILSLGPLLHLGRQTIHHPFPIPLPYILFYYMIPGFQGLRNTQRWEMLFILATATLIGLVFAQITTRFKFKKKFIIYILLTMGVIAEFYPITFVKVPQKKDFPQVYSWMATTPKDSTFIEMPIYNWNDTPYVEQELLREYYGTENFRRIVNGYSGFSPPPWQDFILDMHNEFPNAKSVKTIHSMGVDYIIVNSNDYNVGYKAKFEKYSGNQVLQQMKKNRSVSMIKKFNDGIYVFAIDGKK